MIIRNTLMLIFLLWTPLSLQVKDIETDKPVEISELKKLKSPYHIEIYTMPFCGHCKSVKKALDDADLLYQTYSIIWRGQDHKEMLQRTGGVDGAPQIFINGYHIGSRKDFDRVVLPKLDSMKKNHSVMLAVKPRN